MVTKRSVVLCVSSIVVAIGVAGCINMHSGPDFDATKAQTFQKGKTSKTDVITAMGQPTTTGGNTDGSFIEYQRQDLSAGPLVGFGIGEVNDKVKLCRFMFDVKDKLKDYNCSEGSPDYSNFGK